MGNARLYTKIGVLEKGWYTKKIGKINAYGPFKNQSLAKLQVHKNLVEHYKCSINPKDKKFLENMSENLIEYLE